ncbi:MAG: glycosyltransferase family 39 protein [bacterium]|nr:glycosyltransferase family 39 protein [bacterium]
MVHPRESLFRPLLLCVIVLAALLRFVQLDSIPYGVNVDEAERGYEAYSLLKTGHDQHGHRWPVTLEGFSKREDNASAISAYAAIPFTAMLGPGVLAVRLPSALAGVLSVIALIYLARRLSGDWRVGVLAGFFLAVSPWHLTVSRTGHEAIWTTTLFLLGAVTYFTALERKPWLLPLSALTWGIGFYGYGPGKVFIPLAALTCIVCTWKQLLRFRKPLFVSAAVGLFLAVPLFWMSFGQVGLGRFVQVSNFSNGFALGLLVSIKNMLVYISPVHWASGLLSTSPFDWLLMFIGIPTFLYFSKHLSPRIPVRGLAIGWLLAALLPAALTDVNPSQLRAIGLTCALFLFGTWGFVALWDRIPSKFQGQKARVATASFSFSLIVLGLVLFWRPAYALRHKSWGATSGYLPAIQPVVQALKTTYANAPEVRIVTDYLNQPQIYIMLLTPWPPETLTSDHLFMQTSENWYTSSKLGRYVFCERETCRTTAKGVLYVEILGSDEPSTLGTHILQRIPIQDLAKVGVAWTISTNP